MPVKMMPRLTFSVVVCTHNRCACLGDAIETVQAQEYPAAAYEIIVVDNASSDDTRAVVNDLSHSGSQAVRYLYESRLGLSRARNTGAQAAIHDVVAYIDDDALADPMWLKALAEAYEDGGTEAVAVAGKVLLVWEAVRPHWFPPALESYLSGTASLGAARRVLGSREYPVGTNLSVRREALLGVGGFTEALTRYNDERDLCWRLRRAGGVVLFAPDALVRHRVPAWRVTGSNLLRRAYWQGVSDVLMERIQEPGSEPPLLRSITVLLVQALGDDARAVWALTTGRPTTAFEHLFWSASRLGRLRARLSLASR